jgi:hypothetical protein
MGWLWPTAKVSGCPTEELKATVMDLLQDDAAAQVFVSESCLKRCVSMPITYAYHNPSRAARGSSAGEHNNQDLEILLVKLH